MQSGLLIILTVAPVLFGLLAWAARPHGLRAVVVGIAAVTIAASGVLFVATMEGGGSRISCAPWVGQLGSYLEAGAVCALLAVGIRFRIWLAAAMGLVQFGLVVLERVHPAERVAAPAFRLDPLSAILVVIISVIGSAIVFYAIGYMREHETHAPRSAASTGRFFFFLIGFLGLMNGLVLTDSLQCLSFFWEGTTLCSFFLIGQDGTPEARASARRALVINSFGGALLSLGAAVDLQQGGDGSVGGVTAMGTLLPTVLLLAAAFTKSAQLPFQSWLLGAMVAPTPVSALLHSSTMVKAGSYLVLRLAPGYVNTSLATVVSLAGAFTFAAASALAISQSNAKKVLAYSTIANLGLIIACAAIPNELARAAALMILVYHALSKAVLFLCVGTIEQHIGSRHIEDMSGLFTRMPMTAVIAVVGMLSMMAPPFGMLMGKWMAIASAARTPAVLILVVVGSALTIFFWAKWMGRILTTGPKERYPVETLSASMRGVLLLFAGAVAASGAASMTVYHLWIRPIAVGDMARLVLQADSAWLIKTVDEFLEWPVLAVFGAVLLVAVATLPLLRRTHVRTPFLCGENVESGSVTFAFRGPMDETIRAQVPSWYFPHLFGESVLTKWANLVAVLLLLSLLAKITLVWIPG